MSETNANPEGGAPGSGDVVADDSYVAAPLAPGESAKRRFIRRGSAESTPHTRISGAWAAVALIVVLGVALVDFIVENTRSVRVDFFSAGGRMPVAVALLAAAVSGAAVVLAVGVCRTAQLRLAIRRRRLSAKHATPAVAVVAVPPVPNS